MLVTKSEVKRTSKKALSLLLALVMLMTSVSVCFGTLAAGAETFESYFPDHKEDAVMYLVKALNGDTIKKIAQKNAINGGTAAATNTTTIKVDTYEEYIEVRDTLIYLHKAIVTSTYYQNLYQATSDTYPGSCLEFVGLEANILGELKAVNKNQEISAEGKEFLDYLFNDSKAVKHSDYNKSAQNTNLTNTVNVYTTDYKGFLEAYKGDYTKVGDIELGYTYTMKMFGKNGSTNLQYTHSYKDSSGCDKSDTYYHHYMWDAAYPLDTNPPKADTSKSNTSIKNDLSAYATYVNNVDTTYTFDKFASMTIAEIEAVISNLDIETNTIKGDIADAGQNNEQDDKYDQLFPGFKDKIEGTKDIKDDADGIKERAEKAKEIAKYTETVREITAYQTDKPNYGIFNWGGFDEATIKADYADFMAKYGSILNDATIYDYFVRQGAISDAYIKAFKDNVVAYDLDDLNVEKIAPFFAQYKDTWADVSEDEKILAYSTLTGYINNIRSYRAETVQKAIFPDGIAYLVDLQEKLNTEVNAAVLYFAKNVNKDYSDVETDAIIAEIATAKSNLAAVNNLKASLADANKALLDDTLAEADTFIAYLYSLLAERFTNQVVVADAEYKALGSPDALDLTAFSKLNVYLSAIEEEILTYIDAQGQGSLITQETRTIYNNLKATVLPKFEAFLSDRGFSQYKGSDLLILREDNANEFFRVNTDKDDDGKGEYEVTDDNVMAIIKLLETALKDPTVAGILGNLINKDEEGNPTGEAFNLAGMLRKLIEENVYSDALLNTILAFIYPAVADIFTDVWAGLPANLDLIDTEVVPGMKADIKANLHLGSVEDATAGLDMPLFPQDIADVIYAKYPQYKAVADIMIQADTAAKKLSSGVILSPWNDDILYTDKTDKDGKVIVNEETGETTKVLNFNWGIDEAANKKQAFLNAAEAALYGLKPLLFALLCNKPMEQFNGYIGYGEGKLSGVDASIITINNATLTLNSIDLTLTATANDGYNNVIAPLFEILGEKVPNASTFNYTVADVLDKGLLTPLENVINKLAANPIEFLLNALPNLMYAIEADLLLTKLDYLETVITYSAGVIADVDLNTADGVGFLMGMLSGIVEGMVGMPVDDGVIYGVDANNVYANVDDPLTVKITGPDGFLNLEELLGGADLTSFAGIWSFLGGMVEMLNGVPAPDASYIATLGTLGTIDTVRSKKPYTYGGDGKAAYITANKADVLQYLVKWVLESGLLSGLVKEPSELIAGIFANLEDKPGDAVAAIVELLNQQAYPAKEYEWFDGTIDGESVLGNSANEIYLNPNNDWTEDKAEYLYNNLDAILSSVLTMAGVEFDLGTTITDAVNGLLTDETLTALAALLAKLDLNALLTADMTEEEKAEALDVNALVNQFLGLDLAAIAAEYADIAAAKEADEDYVYNFGVNDGTTTFAAVLADMLAPLSVVLDFLLADGKLTITIGEETVELLGADGYNNAILPLLEALDCKIAEGDTTLEVIINTLVAKVDAIATGDVIKNIIDVLPGVLYFVASNGLSTAVMNLLQPVLVIVDTIRPVFDVMDLLNTLEIGEEGAKTTIPALIGVEKLDLKNINIDFVLAIVESLTGLNLAGLQNVIYDACYDMAVEYESASTLIGENGKKGEFTEDFSAADLLTVVLSFVLEWVTVADNGAKLDEMLGTNGIVASIGKVFDDLEITYGTPEWYYWFDSEEAFDAYLNNREELPNTLAALEYPNDWSDESAQYIADNLASLVDMVIGLLEINGKKYESVSALLNDLVYGDFNITIGEGEEAITINYLFSDETINALIGFLNGVLANIDDALLDAGYLLDVDLVGLKNYTCEEEITTIGAFVEELANVLDTYAPTIVNLLFFGDDIRLAKKSDKTDTIVINGGLGYEKGLALILEALGCKVPAADEATTANVLGALAARVEAILANPVNEVIDMLPNLVYFLNANGASVAVNNILAPVYGILDKLTVFGLDVNLAEILGFDLKYLSLADILALVEEKTELDLEAAEEILVNLCFGEIKEADYTYKMVADRKDTITVILTTALMLVSDEEFAAKLDELLGTEVIAAIKSVFESAPVEYATPDWEYAVADNETLDIIDYAITYPNNWTEETAQYVANLLTSAEFDALVAGLIDSNYKSISDLLNGMVDIYSAETLAAIQKLLGDLIGGLDADLKEIVDVALGAADALLGADVKGLLEYDVSKVNDKESFINALTGMLMEVEGLVDWLLLGEDYEFFVNNDKETIITINGGHGYANGLALILEALGCKELPTVYDKEEIDTEATVKAVLTSVANRIDEIFANPVVEVLNVLPNVIYFLNANGVSIAINNLIGAINALLIKLEGFGLEVDINELVNLKNLLGVTTDINLGNLTMATLLAVAGELTGLDLAAIEDVLVGFALGEINVYESVSAIGGTAKMEYKDEFDKHDLVTVVATLALITIADGDNAEVLKKLIGEDIYGVIMNILNLSEVDVQEFDWQFTDKVGQTFSAFDSSELYEGHQYGPHFTPEMAQSMADNFGEFVDNIIYLVGIQINGENIDNLTDLINGLLNGSVYNSKNVVAIRDALAGVLAGIENLEVNGVKVGGYIVDVLKKAEVADLAAVKDVKVADFTEDREAFVKALCDVLAPIYNVLKYVLADKDLAFFVNGVETDAIVLKGAEGYAYGIIPLLEALGCKDIIAPADYYAAVEADGSVLLTSILNPLLNRVDEIVNGDPGQAILDMLPNLIYFINSNGIDTVVKNTLNAVYALLAAIEPIAKIDLYALIGIDLAEIDFEWLFSKLLEIIADKTGYKFEDLNADAVAELTIGKLESYTSANGKTAYRMVYAAGESGGKAEMATVISRLIITFVMHENNQEILLGLLKDTFGMSDTAAKYVGAVLSAIAKSSVETQLGMDSALALVYAVYTGAEIGASNAATGMKDLNKEWTTLLKEMQNSRDEGEALAGDIIAGILDLDIFDDIIDPDEGIAPNGLLKFFNKISEFFKGIIEFFKNLFSFGK